jgi:molecular chaperone HscB
MLDFSKNYFELFGLESGFQLDEAMLARRYRELQRVIHPDRYANATEQERRLSIQGASLINQAFETLKDPLARAEYLLTLQGMALHAPQETTQDMDFLMQQMELREELAEIRQQPDPYAAVSDLSNRIDDKLQELVEQLATRFESATPEQLEEAREILRKLRFLRKLHSETEAMVAALEDELT